MALRTRRATGMWYWTRWGVEIPHLRNMYEKVGFDVIRPNLQSGNATNIGLPTQKKGFGFIHDGSISLTEFLAAPVFTSTTQQERDLFAFLLAFPTESAPAVGRQVTADAGNKNSTGVTSTINTLIAQVGASRCDLVVKGVIGGTAKGWVYDSSVGKFVPDSLGEPMLTESDLRAAIGSGDALTYTGVPLGAGVRLGIDRDRDGWPDRTEVALHTDPVAAELRDVIAKHPDEPSLWALRQQLARIEGRLAAAR